MRELTKLSELFEEKIQTQGKDLFEHIKYSEEAERLKRLAGILRYKADHIEKDTAKIEKLKRLSAILLNIELQLKHL